MYLMVPLRSAGRALDHRHNVAHVHLRRHTAFRCCLSRTWSCVSSEEQSLHSHQVTAVFRL